MTLFENTITKILSALPALMFVSLFFFSVLSAQNADVGLGLGLSPWDDLSKKQDDKKKKQPDPFIRILAIHFKSNEDELYKLWSRGFGRNELIKLLLISQKSGVELKEIVKQRDKKTRLSELSEKYSLNYGELLDEQAALRKELDYQVSISTETVDYKINISTRAPQSTSQSSSTITGE